MRSSRAISNMGHQSSCKSDSHLTAEWRLPYSCVSCGSNMQFMLWLMPWQSVDSSQTHVRYLLCQCAVQLRQGNVHSTGITTTAKLLLPPGVSHTHCLHSVILLNLSLQFLKACWFANDYRGVTQKISCDKRRPNRKQRWKRLRPPYACALAGGM